MSDREREMGRLAAREQEKSADSDGDSAEEENTTEKRTTSENTTTPSDTENAPERLNVKDRESTAFMYLPESLNNDLNLACQSVKFVYQQETGVELGKNRYLYPIVLMVGVDAAQDLSYDEIQNLVERIDEIEDGF